jgi:EAL domain-containing protein (putative c-di-GMP-specific phosphodiesterase class I)
MRQGQGRRRRQQAGDPGHETPLHSAIGLRDRDTMSMVSRAIAQKEVLLAFQPVVAAGGSGKPAFYEGLIRVLDDTGRVIPARDFIGAIEATEIGRQLDTLALEMGFIALATDPGLRLAVNLSARSIGYPRWAETLRRGLIDDPTAGERLILEITEGSAMSMPELVAVFLRTTRRDGVSFALDDFGTGQTSFRHLRSFQFDILKIDADFVRGVAGSADNQVLTAAIVSLARHLDMMTVAESVETAEDAAWLARIGVDCLQGYYFGAPSATPPWAVEKARKRA